MAAIARPWGVTSRWPSVPAGTIWRWVVLIVAGVYFLRLGGQPERLHLVPRAVGPARGRHHVITIVLMLPTTVYVHLRLPRLRRLLEGITILPIVIPPVVLIVGVLQIVPGSLKNTPYLLSLEYVVLAMPFAFRAIDAGLRALDLKTIVEASSSLGAGWLSTLWRVVLPNLRTALLSAVVLTVALVLGEYTMASLALYQTFPVWIYVNSQTSGQVSVAASLLALFDRNAAVAQDGRRLGHVVYRRTSRNAGKLMMANITGNTTSNAAAAGRRPGAGARA